MSVLSWGTGKVGELGAGRDNKEALEPILLERFRGKRIRSVACGEQHSMAVGETGDVYVWGRAKEGQLGNGERKAANALKPVRVEGLRHERVVAGVCGYNHCLAVTVGGKLYQWGMLHKHVEGSANKEYFGMAIGLSGLNSDRMKRMVGRSHSTYYAAGATGEELEELSRVQNFGSFTPYTQPSPEVVTGLQHVKVVEVAAGYSFSLAVTSQGEVYSWGFNEKCQLGLGHRYNQSVPQLVPHLQGVHIVSATCGQQHSVLLSAAGHVYTFGLGVFGQLGHGVSSDERFPRRVEALVPAEEGVESAGERIVQIACGSHHTLALGVSGTVWTWGSAEYGQQGGTNAYEDWATGQRAEKSAAMICATPRSLSGCFDGKHIAHVSCGHLHNLATARDGSVYSWGWGSYGVLGHGNHRFQLVPKLIRRIGGERIVQTAAGAKHSLAVNAGSSTLFAFDFKVALNNPRYSDVSFRVDGKTFAAHRAIVFARCPYLGAYTLLAHRFRPTDADSSPDPNPVVQLPQMRQQVFTAVLHYLYTDHLKAASHWLGEIKRVAAKFRLPRLEALCTAQLHSQSHSRQYKPPKSTFAAELAQVVDGPEWSDVVFAVADEEEGEAEGQVRHVHAHKVLLTSRSDYFKRIFGSSFAEGEQPKSKPVAIQGTQPRVFMAMLEYIYTGRLPAEETVSSNGTSASGSIEEAAADDPSLPNINPDTVVELLLAADRFLLDDLKQLCEAALEQSLESSNATWMLELSDRASAPRLKKATLEFLAALLYRAQRPRAGTPVEDDEEEESESKEEAIDADAKAAEEEGHDDVPAGPTSVEELGGQLSPHLLEELRAFLAAYAPATVPPPTKDTPSSSSSSSTATLPATTNQVSAIDSLPPLVD